MPTDKENYVKTEDGVTIFFNKNINLTRSVSNKNLTKKAQLFVLEVGEIINEHKIDVICAENLPISLPAAYNILLNLTAVQHQIPIVLQMHSFTALGLQTELINQLMWTKVSCVSKSITGDCFKKGADINILSTDYLGVDTNVFCPKNANDIEIREQLGLLQSDKIVLTATRIIQGRNNILQAKGLINLIQAFSRISSRHKDLKLVIAVGKAPERLDNEFEQSLEMLMGYIKLHNIESKTIVKTFALNEIPKIYKEADVFVLASENETFGQVFIEAMSSGIPVIGTKVGGIPEIISDSYNGYLIPPNDVSALAQKIEKLLFDEVIKNEFIRTGLKTVNNKFTLEKQLDNFVDTLRSVI